MRTWLSSSLLVATLATGCGGNQPAPASSAASAGTHSCCAGTRGHTGGAGDHGMCPMMGVQPTTAAQASLTQAEADMLRHMRQEEKLARDVYQALEPSGFVFVRIQGAERRHFAATGMLLQRYGMADPAANQPPGVFTDPDLQAHYNAFVERGKRSRLDALAVGMEVEELDLHDLDAAIKATSHEDVRAVYANLQRASRNHLRAFHRNLVAEGGSYTPKHIDRATYDQILASPVEPGMGGMMGMGMGPMGNGPGPMGRGPGAGTCGPGAGPCTPGGGMGNAAISCPHMSGTN